MGNNCGARDVNCYDTMLHDGIHRFCGIHCRNYFICKIGIKKDR